MVRYVLARRKSFVTDYFSDITTLLLLRCQQNTSKNYLIYQKMPEKYMVLNWTNSFRQL